ncbi:MAG: bacteriophage abortive infection AbiH family protein, partial [Candidatus Gastranaerophilales bacterium]|nr:bacteriophage abortive infection AbiH family protein [Candidatus Gastranaerophilales bacterium]
MDILILGNGFDLAHKLDTKYSDFLKYCQEKYNTTRSVGVDKSNNFLYNNIWAKHFLNKTLNGDKWIDLENEIYNVIVKLSKLPYFKNSVSLEKYEDIAFWISKDYMELNFDEIQKYFRKPEGFYTPRDCYCVKIKDFVEFLYSQLRDFVKEFEKYLIEEEDQKIKNMPKFNLRVNNDCASLLNFNYT